MAATEYRVYSTAEQVRYSSRYTSVKQSLHLLYILENDILFEQLKQKKWQPQSTGCTVQLSR